MEHADHTTIEHVIHMIVCCIVGLGAGALGVWAYNKIKDSKNHNP